MEAKNTMKSIKDKSKAFRWAEKRKRWSHKMAHHCCGWLEALILLHTNTHTHTYTQALFKMSCAIYWQDERKGSINKRAKISFSPLYFTSFLCSNLIDPHQTSNAFPLICSHAFCWHMLWATMGLFYPHLFLYFSRTFTSPYLVCKWCKKWCINI